MILARHTLEATLTPAAAWATWTAVASWPEWDPTLDRADLGGPFVQGARLDCRRPGGGSLRLVLAGVEEGRSFTLERRLPGTRIASTHSLEPSPLGVRLTQQVEARGWTAWLVAWVLGPPLRAALPGILRGLARRALQDAGA